MYTEASNSTIHGINLFYPDHENNLPCTWYTVLQGIPPPLPFCYDKTDAVYILCTTDVRDNIVQALACFICYPQSLQVLEELPLSRFVLITYIHEE